MFFRFCCVALKGHRTDQFFYVNLIYINYPPPVSCSSCGRCSKASSARCTISSCTTFTSSWLTRLRAPTAPSSTSGSTSTAGSASPAPLLTSGCTRFWAYECRHNKLHHCGAHTINGTYHTIYSSATFTLH